MRASAWLLLVGCSRSPEQAQRAGPVPSALASTKAPEAVPPPQAPEAAVRAWNDALNRHDLDALRVAYASEVMFYGRRMTAAEVIAAKAQAFAKDPDFRQEVSDFASSEALDTVTIRFTKAWTAKGVVRRVGGSLGLIRADGHLLVASEMDVATSEAQAKPSWSCGRCRNTDKTGPDGLTARDVKPAYFAWTLEVARAGGSRKLDLNDALQAVDLGGLSGWRCTVGAAQGGLAKGPMETSSTFYVEDRELYCSQLDGGSVRLISDVACSPRGSETNSDYIELRPGDKLRLACTMLPSQ
jgi:hypothetical protein